MSKPRINAFRAIQIVELTAIFAIIALSFPTGCPLSQPQLEVAKQNLPYELRELNRIEHQTSFFPLILFSFPAQDYRRDTAIRFHYRVPDTQQALYLQFEEGQSFRDYALLYHPLLKDLEWPSIHEGNLRLMQKQHDFNSIDEFLSKHISKENFAADRISANTYHLSPNSYTPIDGMASLGSIRYILSSYNPAPQDGWWSVFDQSLDLSSATPNASRQLSGRITGDDNDIRFTSPFFIGDFHVDYKKMRP